MKDLKDIPSGSIGGVQPRLIDADIARRINDLNEAVRELQFDVNQLRLIDQERRLGKPDDKLANVEHPAGKRYTVAELREKHRKWAAQFFDVWKVESNTEFIDSLEEGE